MFPSNDRLQVTDLRCECKNNPLGIDIAVPQLSWRIETSRRSTMQTAFQIQASAERDELQKGMRSAWDTKHVDSDRSIYIPYGGPSLSSGDRIYWRVRIWDNHGRVSLWSAPAWWEMGLLVPTDWHGEWIEPNLKEDITQSQPCPMMRREFVLNGAVRSARAYASSLGLYELHLNGHVVGDQVLTPGWTSYDRRIQYQTYDVRDMLREGLNTVGAILGDGWYRGYLGWIGKRNLYGEKLGLILEMRILYEDGRTQTVTTDPDWMSSTGSILESDIYNGEIYDARLERDGWDQVGYDDSNWTNTRRLEHSKTILVAPEGPPVRRILEIHPVRVFETPSGDTVVDMGQNMVGWVRLRVKGNAGTKIRLRHAEVLDNDGNFYTENLRTAAQQIIYILKGGGEFEVFEPHFTFQGFRYVAVDRYPGKVAPDDLTGIVIHSDMTPTGIFKCSDELINQLQHNIQWSQKGNFVDVPTDCPQRDERFGWTGDAQVFCPTACYNFDVSMFFTKWLKDLAADQKPDGSVPFVIPNVINVAGIEEKQAAAGWSDAAVLIPWHLYVSYGNIRLLETQYASMKAWVEYVRREAGSKNLWRTGFHFGDWLAFTTADLVHEGYPGATTAKDLIASCFYAHSVDLLKRTAKILDKIEDAREYANLFEDIREAILAEYITPNGRVSSNTQTAYALVLAFDLLPDELREKAAERLAKNVAEFGHITTGFLGTPLIAAVLSRFGYPDEAFMLLNRRDYPSWLYPILLGATTIWERWDGIKTDGSFQDKMMNSFNHYAYGAIGDWLYKNVAGINPDPDNPGFKHAIIAPKPGGNIRWANGSLITPYGTVKSAWNIEESCFDISLPPNTYGTVRLPGTDINALTENGKPIQEIESVQIVDEKDNEIILKIGSGRYHFEIAH